MQKKISGLSKILMFVAGLLLATSLLVPIWSIYLDAPQYPEGLSLQIWAHKLSGDVDIINGLNHYIGMKTLHADDFMEFKILPVIIIVFAVLFIIVGLAAPKKWVTFLLVAFLIFGIIAMADFWKWEYDYGHNLDPNAAIKVPGMAYQPPLIGFKQLLNFGAYSYPDTGGWFFIISGILLLTVFIIENKIFQKKRFKRNNVVALFTGLMLLHSCGKSGPEPVKLHSDACESCKMAISDGRYMAEIITKKGRVYKFDDLSCLLDYTSGMEPGTIKAYYIGNAEKDNELFDATTAWYISHESLRSPMGGNTAAYTTKEAAAANAAKYNVTPANWHTISQSALRTTAP